MVIKNIATKVQKGGYFKVPDSMVDLFKGLFYGRNIAPCDYVGEIPDDAYIQPVHTSYIKDLNTKLKTFETSQRYQQEKLFKANDNCLMLNNFLHIYDEAGMFRGEELIPWCYKQHQVDLISN